MVAAFSLFLSALRRQRVCRHHLHRLVTVMALMTTLLVASAARADAQEVVEYYGTDALGSIRVVFAPDGTVKARSDYLPFGEEWQSATPGGPLPSQRFTGQQRDAEENLDYFNARSLQTRTGRFTRVDPVFSGLSNPQRWNRYSYALNSPLKFTDPSGLIPIERRDPPGPGGGDGDGGFGGWPESGYGGNGPCYPACEFPTDPPPGSGYYPEPDDDGDDDDDEDPGGDDGETGEETKNPTTTGTGTTTTGPAVVINPATAAIAARVVMTLRAISPLLRVGLGAGAAGMKVSQFLSQHQARMQSMIAQAQQMYPKLVGKPVQLHHIVPKFMGGDPRGPTVPLDPAYHQLITNEFRALWPYAGGVPPSAAHLEQMMLKVYTKYPIW